MDVLAPSPGESITEVIISNWIKQDGEPVQKNELIAEIETEKASLEIVSEAAGTLNIKKKTGEPVKVGDIIAVIDTAAATAEKTKSTEKESDVQPVDSPAPNKNYPSPSATKIMAEKNIQPEQVVGSGKDGRITKGDIQNLPETAKPSTNTDTLTESVAPDTATDTRKQNRSKMTTLRKKISEKLVSVKNETAMLTTFNEVDMSAVMSARSKYKDLFKDKHQIGLGFMSFFTKACTTALLEFPSVNGKIEGDEIITHNYVDMGIAVSAPKGLMVPIIRNADRLSLADIEKNIVELADKARNSKLTITEMVGGTFTITNGGVFGSMLSTPILNPPQSAILGMHNIIKRPVAVKDQVEIRPIMYVALSYDHRIVDGRESVGFLVRVKQLIEDPVRLLLNV